MSQRTDLARPFPDNLIKKNPSGGGTYVNHGMVNQRLVYIVGGYDWELKRIIRGDVDERPPNPNGKSAAAKAGHHALTNVVCGVVCRLTLTVDGETNHYEEAGDCEDPHNWFTDGARMKDAMSDSYKRCAMRASLGLHLWRKDEDPYLLYDWLMRRQEPEEPKVDPETGEIPA